MAEPINCPFCGEYGCDINQSSIPNIEGGWKRAVYCNVCFCEGPPAKTDAEAIERWNTRAAGVGVPDVETFCTDTPTDESKAKD